MRSRQELLDYLLERELKELKKICFKYERRPLLGNKITIVEENLNEGKDEYELKSAGRYERVNIKSDFKFEHKILIDTSVVDDYLNYKPDYYNSYFGRRKKCYKRQLMENIRHEILHGFCYENFESFSNIEGSYRDASPIFISVLTFLNCPSGHQCERNFRKSPIYNDVIKIKSFKELEQYLMKKMLEYEKVVDALQSSETIQKDNYFIIKNNFEYAHRDAGFYGNYSSINIACCNDKSFSSRTETNLFEIGCNITPKMIEQLVHKKINNQSFNEILVDKYYCNKEKLILITRSHDGNLSKVKLDEPKSA